MENWAIVVGVNDYWDRKYQLKGAVGDARKLMSWLIESGSVPAKNLFLLTWPAVKPDEVPFGVEVYDATRSKFNYVVKKVMFRSGKNGGRLFFYFSGHGLMKDSGFSAGKDQGLLLADFTWDDAQNSVTLSSVFDYFSDSSFREQIYIVDACRNFPDRRVKFSFGSLTKEEAGDGGVAKVDVVQHRIYSTAQGLRSAELLDVPGDERGAFTEVLLEALRGKGPAKVFCINDNNYHVRIDHVFRYVEREVLARKINVSKNEGETVFQRPKVELGSANFPALVTIPREQVDNEELTVFVAPNTVWPLAEVEIRADGGLVEERVKPITNVPLALPRLPPMGYTLHALAPSHRVLLTAPQERELPNARWSFDLYEPRTFELTLKPVEEGAGNGPGPSGGPGPAQPAGGGAGGGEAGGESGATKGEMAADDDAGPGSRSDKTRLVVRSDDPLAALEIRDASGVVLKTGEGRIELADAAPGLYRARLMAPEGESTEELVRLLAGEAAVVNMTAPPPGPTRLLEELSNRTDLKLDRNTNALELGGGLGAVTSPRLSTLLTFEGGLNPRLLHSREQKLPGLSLRGIGRESVPRDSGVLHILFAFEAVTRQTLAGYLENVRVRLWPFGAEAPVPEEGLTPYLTEAGVVEFGRQAVAGPHWLSVELPDESPVAFSVTVLPGRRTMLVMHQAPDGQINVFHYYPEIAPDVPAPEPDDFVRLRRLELLQRFYLNGQFESAYRNAEELLRGDWTDPVVGCLAGYLMLRRGGEDERLDWLSRRMVESFDGLSDSHVLRAKVLKRQGRGAEAVGARFRALRRGLPVFAEGSAMLLADVRGESLWGTRARLLEALMDNYRISDQLGAAWMPPPSAFEPGNVFEDRVMALAAGRVDSEEVAVPDRQVLVPAFIKFLIPVEQWIDKGTHWLREEVSPAVFSLRTLGGPTAGLQMLEPRFDAEALTTGVRGLVSDIHWEGMSAEPISLETRLFGQEDDLITQFFVLQSNQPIRSRDLKVILRPLGRGEEVTIEMLPGGPVFQSSALPTGAYRIVLHSPSGGELHIQNIGIDVRRRQFIFDPGGLPIAPKGGRGR